MVKLPETCYRGHTEKLKNAGVRRAMAGGTRGAFGRRKRPLRSPQSPARVNTTAGFFARILSDAPWRAQEQLKQSAEFAQNGDGLVLPTGLKTIAEIYLEMLFKRRFS